MSFARVHLSTACAGEPFPAFSGHLRKGEDRQGSHRYLAAGRPIAAFGPHDSVLERSLDATRTGRIFDWDEEAPLNEYLTALYTRTIAFAPDADAITSYTRRALAGRFASIL